MVISRLRARISNGRKIQSTKTRRYDCKKFKDPEIRYEYTKKLNAYFQSNQLNDQASIGNRWPYLSNGIRKTAQQVLGMAEVNSRNNRNNWYDDECKRATEEKNNYIIKCIRKTLREVHCKNMDKQERRRRRPTERERENMKTVSLKK